MTKPKIIVAATKTGLIGANGTVPWRKPADLKRFKVVTMGGVLIMGRKTFDSIGRRCLPGRETLVISRSPQEDVKSYTSLEAALEAAAEMGLDKIWVIGGAEIYKMALPLVGEIDFTLVDEDIQVEDGIYFDMKALNSFTLLSSVTNPDDSTLEHRLYKRDDS